MTIRRDDRWRRRFGIPARWFSRRNVYAGAWDRWTLDWLRGVLRLDAVVPIILIVAAALTSRVTAAAARVWDGIGGQP